MRERLFIRLGERPREAVSWLRAAPGAEAVRSGTLAEAAAEAAGRSVIALVPNAALLLTGAVVPSRNRQRIAQALPFLLEDQLIGDLEDLHFAAGRRAADGAVAAAVVERERMDEWLAALRTAGIEPDGLVPELFAAPLSAGAWTLILEGEEAALRTGEQAGFAVDLENVATAVAKALEEAGERRPARLEMFDLRGADAPALPALSGCEIALERSTPAQAPLAFLAGHYDERNAIDLLQGGYDRGEQLGRLWRPWRGAAALLALVVALNGALLARDYLELSRERQALAQTIDALYREAFPEARKVVDARAQMEQGLAELRRGARRGGSGFLGLLGGVAAAFGQAEGLELQRINYREGRLSVALVIGDLQALDALTARLTRDLGLSVDIQSASARNNKVDARLEIAEARP